MNPNNFKNCIKYKSITSEVFVNKTTNKVYKRIYNFINYKVFERELFWLTYLNNKGYKWCPKLLESNIQSKIMVLEYVGERLTLKNAPNNWKSQVQTILDDLKIEGLKHNDIKCEELLVKNGTIYLIDYGWMTKGDDWSCNGIADPREKPVHIFRDENAMERIEAELLKKAQPQPQGPQPQGPQPQGPQGQLKNKSFINHKKKPTYSQSIVNKYNSQKQPTINQETVSQISQNTIQQKVPKSINLPPQPQGPQQLQKPNESNKPTIKKTPIKIIPKTVKTQCKYPVQSKSLQLCSSTQTAQFKQVQNQHPQFKSNYRVIKNPVCSFD